MLNFIKSKIAIRNFRLKWRRLNLHNETIPISLFTIDTVSVGKNSYGPLDIRNFDNNKEKLIIGNYVSISSNVVFILGGNHQINTITNFPLYSKLIELSPEIDAETKGTICVEDEVWIGTSVMILSGVHIGKGAIIAAGSVVTKNVPNYAIVGGNPAKLIRYRFNEEIIKALLSFNLAEIDENRIKQNINDFYKPLDLEIINKLVNDFQ